MDDLNDKVTGNTLTAAEWNQVPSEIQNVIEGLGITLSGGDLNQLGKAIAGYIANGDFYTDSGAANAYVLSVIGSKQAPTGYTDGMQIAFIPDNNNTGSSTVNVAGLGLKNIKDADGNNPSAGTISTADVMIARYNSSAGEFRLFRQLTLVKETELKSGRKNVIINGDFDVWQRATSQVSSGYGSDDRWGNEHTISTKTHSQQTFTLGQTDVPNNPKYFSRTIVTSVANVAAFVRKTHKIESVKTFAGDIAVLSFWAKADANKNIAVEFTQVFGTGGAPSAPTTAIGVTTIALTTSWQKFSVPVTFPGISGKTLGTDNNDNIQVLFWLEAGSNNDARTNTLGQQSGTFDISQVQLEPGNIATNFEYRPLAEEVSLCERFFQKSYNLDIDPGTVSSAGAENKRKVSIITSTININPGFRTPMRGIPSITTYSPVTGASGVIRNDVTALDVGTAIANPGFNKFTINLSVAATNPDSYSAHWTADSEI